MKANTEYRIIQSGCFTEQDFEFILLPGKRTYTPKVRKLIKTAWDDARLNPELILFNGKTISLMDSFNTEDPERHGKMLLTVQETDYRSFYGTNLNNPFIIPKVQLANPLAACAVVETIEGTVFVGERSKRLAEVSGLWHVPGGTLDEVINPIDFMKQELHEELNISSDDIQSAVCLGLAENMLMLKPEFLCYFHLKLSERELTAGILTAKDREEHTDFVFVPMEELNYFVSMHPFAPIGKAAIQRYLEYIKCL
jgi:8-oxo-dGTP pyrophosphatase MutT (NUDIX family)